MRSNCRRGTSYSGKDVSIRIAESLGIVNRLCLYVVQLEAFLGLIAQQHIADGNASQFQKRPSGEKLIVGSGPIYS